MRILFIRPNLIETRSTDALEPLCFAILKSLTPGDVEVALYDEQLEPIPFDAPADLVALTVETYTARRAYQIAGEFRKRGVPVVMGGYHPTFLPDEALCFADSVAIGDAEGTWPEIVADARKGKLKPLYRQDGFPDLAGVMPDRSIFAGKRYGAVRMVQYGRGCRYACEFCSIRAFYGDNLRHRPVREVVEEIERLAPRHVFLVDDNVFIDVPKAKELFRALIPLRIQWSTQVSIDIAHDPELMRLLEQSGCTAATVGFESLDIDNLRQMRKAWNVKHQDYQTSIRILQDAGIMIFGTFVMGYDRDKPEAFDATVEFAIRNKFFLAHFNPLTPTPGAALYDRLRAEGRLLYDRWWLDPAYRYGSATYRPAGMTPEELTAGCYRARSRFNALSSLAYRALDSRTHLRSAHRLGIFLGANLISRREIHSKQGLPLGGADPLDVSPLQTANRCLA
ncbi:MAG: B12-binding domain-containing radical SAM protein [Candidatus Sericytochromatia bacterium]|nr:B12-binding domain-containing radical SAM protein [Candidatus Tanganyikabacteria bacterium]